MILIKNGEVCNVDGSFEDGVSILIENGKIREIGKDLVAPLDAKIIDAEGLVVMPGFIDAHTHLGMWEDGIGFEGADGNETTDPITPQLRAIDAINPMDRTFDETVEGGVTCVASGPGSANVIGGQFVTIKTAGNIIDSMIIDEYTAMKCAFGENPKRVYNDQKKSPMTRMATASLLRETLTKAKEYAKKLETAKEDTSKKPDVDFKMDALLPIVRGEKPLKAHAHRADDILTAIRIAKEFDVKLTLEHCTEGHLIADHLSKEGYPAIVGPSFGERCKFELQNLTFDTPGILCKAGVKVALMTDHPVIPLQHINVCGALAHKSGMPMNEVFKALTINPAEILGIDDRTGSITEGKDADIVVWDRHPLDIQASVLYTIIDGKIVFEK